MISTMKSTCKINFAAIVKTIAPQISNKVSYFLYLASSYKTKIVCFIRIFLTGLDYCGIVYLTLLQDALLRNSTTPQKEISMAHSTPKNHDKIERLQGDRVLNPHPQNVSDPLFRDPSREFFDPHDLLQVKYEMLRSVEKEGRPVSEAAKRFGFSRPCFYQARAAFEKHGLAGLIRAHPGPKSARKLTDEVMEFIEQHVKEGEPLRSRVLTPKIQERFGIEIHPRSIERAVNRRKKEWSQTRKSTRKSRK